MFLRKLTEEDRVEFLKHATLIALSESPALWNGKRAEELTSNDRFHSLRISESGDIFERLFLMKSECLPDDSTTVDDFFEDGYCIRLDFERELKELPIGSVNEPGARLAILKEIQRLIIDGNEDEDEDEDLIEAFKSPESVKIALFELVVLASVGGKISDINKSLIDCFAERFNVESFIVDDIVLQAKSISDEITRALNIVLE